MLSALAAMYSQFPALLAVSVGVLGLVVGSFLNVVIYRLPIMLERDWRAQAADFLPPPSEDPNPAYKAPPTPFNLTVPRSACPACKTPIAAWQNIPVVSWVILRGRCASCRTAISLRYPLVELATGLLSGWVAWHFGWSVATACGLLVTWMLIPLMGIDIDHQLLPDNITLPLMWAGLLAAVAFEGGAGGQTLPVSPRTAIIGAASGYLSLWIVFQAYRLATGKEGMGYGDFKLLAALGAWLGWKLLPVVILLAAATGAVLGISMILLRGRDRAAPMAFGPYLAGAGWVAMMYGEGLIASYLRLSGLRQ